MFSAINLLELQYLLAYAREIVQLVTWSVLFEMADIEELSGFFKYFELCGVQSFSLRDLKEDRPPTLSKMFHSIYFVFLLAVLPYTMHYFFKSYAIDSFQEKRFMIEVMTRVLSYTLISSVVFGLLESNFKSGKFKTFIRLSKKLTKILNQTFLLHSNYRAMKWKFVVVILLFTLLIFTNVLTLGLAALKVDDSIFPALIGFFPVYFEVLILVVFNFYVELINFELENLVTVVSKSIEKSAFSKTVNFNSSKAFAVCRCYKIIYDMSLLVDNFLRYSVLTVWSCLVMATISNIYNNLIEINLGTDSSQFTLFVQICKLTDIYTRCLYDSLVDAVTETSVNVLAIVFTIYHCQKSSQLVR